MHLLAQVLLDIDSKSFDLICVVGLQCYKRARIITFCLSFFRDGSGPTNSSTQIYHLGSEVQAWFSASACSSSCRLDLIKVETGVAQ